MVRAEMTLVTCWVLGRVGDMCVGGGGGWHAGTTASAYSLSRGWYICTTTSRDVVHHSLAQHALVVRHACKSRRVKYSLSWQ